MKNKKDTKGMKDTKRIQTKINETNQNEIKKERKKERKERKK